MAGSFHRYYFAAKKKPLCLQSGVFESAENALAPAGSHEKPNASKTKDNKPQTTVVPELRWFLQRLNELLPHSPWLLRWFRLQNQPTKQRHPFVPSRSKQCFPRWR
jgi:hypothetical protein